MPSLQKTGDPLHVETGPSSQNRRRSSLLPSDSRTVPSSTQTQGARQPAPTGTAGDPHPKEDGDTLRGLETPPPSNPEKPFPRASGTAGPGKRDEAGVTCGLSPVPRRFRPIVSLPSKWLLPRRAPPPALRSRRPSLLARAGGCASGLAGLKGAVARAPGFAQRLPERAGQLRGWGLEGSLEDR